MSQNVSEIPIARCRVCGGAWHPQPLLRYESMPRAAQFLPDAQTLADDHGVPVEVRQCSACGLVQLAGEPVSYYREVVRAAAFSEEMGRFRQKQFAEFVARFSLAGKKVLEIGCGRGEYLSLMQPCGVRAFGLEYSEAAVAHCRSQGLRVTRGFVDRPDFALEGAPFDAFFMITFLEHLPDPNATLRGIAHLLQDDGVGLVEVPNFDMILQKDLFLEFTTDHLFYFTEDTFRETLSRNGLVVVECKAVWHEYLLSAVVKKRKRFDLSRFHNVQVQRTAELDAYLRRFGDRNVAVWGAGHQALATLALLGLGGRIKYVVDSAPFKQGKFTPATHVPIVPPETLQADPVEAVIVMAASYSDEVARILRQRFGADVQVAILRDFGLETI